MWFSRPQSHERGRTYAAAHDVPPAGGASVATAAPPEAGTPSPATPLSVRAHGAAPDASAVLYGEESMVTPAAKREHQTTIAPMPLAMDHFIGTSFAR
jgi:hypothetical protein